MSAAAKLVSASYSWRGITARPVQEICGKARHMTAGPSRSFGSVDLPVTRCRQGPPAVCGLNRPAGRRDRDREYAP